MSKIQVGDRVTCINDRPISTGRSSGLVKGRDYIVYGLLKCPNCKDIGIDIGMVIPDDWISTKCGACNSLMARGVGAPRAYAVERFVKVEEDKQQEKTVAVSAIKLTEQLSLSEN